MNLALWSHVNASMCRQRSMQALSVSLGFANNRQTYGPSEIKWSTRISDPNMLPCRHVWIISQATSVSFGPQAADHRENMCEPASTGHKWVAICRAIIRLHVMRFECCRTRLRPKRDGMRTPYSTRLPCHRVCYSFGPQLKVTEGTMPLNSSWC